jgi:hypothetical protein
VEVADDRVVGSIGLEVGGGGVEEQQVDLVVQQGGDCQNTSRSRSPTLSSSQSIAR